MTDRISDNETRRLLYQNLKDREAITASLQGEYGKWIVSSLLLLHGGALAFVANDPGTISAAVKILIGWHAPGIVFALLCGFSAWLNWSAHWKYYMDVDPRMIESNDFWPTVDKKLGLIMDWSNYAAIFFGLVSGLCIVGSAVHLFCKIDEFKHAAQLVTN